MDVLTNKNYGKFDYVCRLDAVPYYYHTLDDKYVYGLTSNLKKDIPYTLHEVKPTDTLDKLALAYYNNPTLYWIIALYNNIQDVFIDLYEYYKVIRIPNYTTLEFGDER